MWGTSTGNRQEASGEWHHIATGNKNNKRVVWGRVQSIGVGISAWAQKGQSAPRAGPPSLGKWKDRAGRYAIASLVYSNESRGISERTPEVLASFTKSLNVGLHTWGTPRFTPVRGHSPPVYRIGTSRASCGHALGQVWNTTTANSRGLIGTQNRLPRSLALTSTH